MKKNTRHEAGDSKPNVRIGTTGQVRTPSSSAERRLDATAAAGPAPVPISARYIDSRLKQFCLR